MSGDDPRADVLARLRRSLRRHNGSGEPARARARARLDQPPPALIPARADLPLDERIALFTIQAEAVQTLVRRIGHFADVPEAVGAFLRDHNLPAQLVVADDPRLKEADWRGSMLEVRFGRAEETDHVGVTTGFAGIAETGTLMLASARATPTMTAFLPDNVVVVLPAERVLRAYEDGLRILREEEGGLPRSINFVTGPSRTGDIEQKILLGAHGPRRLLVLLVGAGD